MNVLPGAYYSRLMMHEDGWPWKRIDFSSYYYYYCLPLRNLNNFLSWNSREYHTRHACAPHSAALSLSAILHGNISRVLPKLRQNCRNLWIFFIMLSTYCAVWDEVLTCQWRLVIFLQISQCSKTFNLSCLYMFQLKVSHRQVSTSCLCVFIKFRYCISW